ncbi:hypothetical Protein YC6258_00740 [Gynuella sunshinyii YC6258]|uniref:Uncharacterized protein n=1 Tax=Gynuella sunshinyii YC6258 TaxID=1445510 RepID=A0A0C5UZS5_9GAMM|nr:hypothetical Protein YC6258_00740 [Gynuella sunshinyii YC6258]
MFCGHCSFLAKTVISERTKRNKSERFIGSRQVGGASFVSR